jgi:glycosyltransferase involved in cell wall biosynthesis
MEAQRQNLPSSIGSANGTMPRKLDDPRAWLQAFERRNKRKLRVLHIGNIANNAYLAAKFLRRAGVEADVLSYDYYHVMGTPEWEELPITHAYGDDYKPSFSSEDLGSYQRPRWFVSGPLDLCVGYLLERRSKHSAQIDFLWAQLERVRYGQVSQAITSFRRNWRARLFMLPYRVARQAAKMIHRRLTAVGLQETSQSFYRLALKLGSKAINFLVAASVRGQEREHARFRELVRDFAILFPDRPDRLSLADLAAYLDKIEPLEKLFRGYDVVQAYATDPILPLVCGKKPFVAFEHGTLRDFIRADDPLHRLTALAYRKADHVFVTNGDCQEHAKWLGCESATPMLHPIDVDQHRQRDEAAIAALRKHYNADVLLFSPIRHDWSVKGVDVHIRALPQIREQVGRKVVLVLAPWGLQIEDSQRLIKALGCQDSVAWLERPLSRPELIKHMQAADVVLDQMTLPHFGATAPQSLAAGTPVIMSYKPESTAWIVSEPAPILPAFTPDEVANAVTVALDPAWRADFAERARNWVNVHHHHSRVVYDHLTAYRQILEKYDVNR